jgi:hypothetical protein
MQEGKILQKENTLSKHSEDYRSQSLKSFWGVHLPREKLS